MQMVETYVVYIFVYAQYDKSRRSLCHDVQKASSRHVRVAGVATHGEAAQVLAEEPDRPSRVVLLLWRAFPDKHAQVGDVAWALESRHDVWRDVQEVALEQCMVGN